MSFGLQAEALSRAQIEGVRGYPAKTRHEIRNRVIFPLLTPVRPEAQGSSVDLAGPNRKPIRLRGSIIITYG